jgi:outer membrane protein
MHFVDGVWRTARSGLLAGVGLVCAVQCVALAPRSAHGETLKEALAFAYNNNPLLMGERARLRAVDENLAIAQSGYRPTVGATFDYSLKGTKNNPGSISDGTTDPRTYTVTATQPLYTGGSVVAGVYEADATIRAERENLRATEQGVLLAAVTAYMDVLRDREVVDVNLENINVLQTELKQVQARFDVGEVTRTDVEQSRASLAQGQAQLEAAKASLRASTAHYLLAVGHPPTVLKDPGEPLRLLPPTLQEAVVEAISTRPAVVQAAYLEKASQSTIRKLIGELLPQFQLQGSYVATQDPSVGLKSTQDATLTGHLSIPIYEAGNVRAQIRQEKETRQGLLENIEQAREQAESDATQAWALLLSSRAQLQANLTQVEANKVALDGVKAEAQVGQRTVLDILNAQQTLLLSQEALISSKHDIVVDAYTVLSTVGRLTADGLAVPVQQYDVEQHYNDTNNKWFDIKVNRDEGYAGYAPSGNLAHDLLGVPN